MHNVLRANRALVNASGDFVLPLIDVMDFSSCDNVISISTFQAL